MRHELVKHCIWPVEGRQIHLEHEAILASDAMALHDLRQVFRQFGHL
ncbi:MAG TPA: hypothetical protein VMB34_25600 [Acetobacteraceae bacterium]|nr:hypothetical protein [Acetobacteraceae bacterium]